MTTTQKIVIGIIGVAIIIAAALGISHKSLGDATVSNYPTWYYNGIVIGSSNSLLTNVISGKCTLTGATSLANGATELLTCPVTGANVGDNVLVTSPTAAVTGGGQGFTVASGSVLSSGVLTVGVENNTGSTQTPTAPALTGVSFLITR